MGFWGFQTRAQATRVAAATREFEGLQTQPREHRRSHSRVRQIRRFEMVEELLLPQSGEGSANAHWLDWTGSQLESTERTFKVVDTMRMHSKMETATATIDEVEVTDVGAYGIAVVYDKPVMGDPHNATWEILTMQTPGDFMGRLDAPLTQNTESVSVTAFRPSGSGHITFDGYDPFGDAWSEANGGKKITVYNPPAQWSGAAFDAFLYDGDTNGVVFCKWFARLARYYIYEVECPVDAGEAIVDNWFVEG